MAMKIGVGLSRLEDGYAAAKAAAADAKRSVSDAQLAIVYGSIDLDQKGVHEGVLSEVDGAIVTGGSSYAEITNAGVEKRSVVVLLASFEGARVRFVDADRDGAASETGDALAKALVDQLGASDDLRESVPVGLYMGSFGEGRQNEILRALRKRLPSMPVFGGLASSRYDLGMGHPDFYQNYQYMGSEVGKFGIRLAVLDLPKKSYTAAFGFDHGWSAVGPEVRFTKTGEQEVFEVDGEPIFDYYRQFLGEQESNDFYKLMIQRYGFAMKVGGDEGRTVLKLPVRVDFETGGITLYPPEEFQGKTARLIQSSRQGLLDGTRKAAESCKAGLGGKTPSLVLMVSCCTRCAILHSRVDSEVEIAKEVFGADVPIFGYYCGGEIFPYLSRVEEIVDPLRDLSGSHYHTTTVGFMAVSAEGGCEAGLPDRPPAAAADHPEVLRLRKMLAESEDILDSTERFLSNMSRKSYRDGELLKDKNRQLELKNEHNEKLQGVVHRYTPHDIWKRLGENVSKGTYELADADGVFTFMFLDVKGFTAYSEKHGASEVVAAINRIFKPATDTIYSCGGDVDKYIGDCIFAAFPDAASGVKAALGIMKLFEKLDKDGNPFSIRIGINSGRAVRANVGSTARREYTYIGDAVNLAQRLESNCTPGKLLLSEGVYNDCGVSFDSAERKEIAVKGKAAPVSVYECGL
jgi:class 3 adenylate cyclase